MKNETTIKVPKKYQHMIEGIYKDSEGYWAYSKEGYEFEIMACHTAHEYSQKDLLAVIRTLKPCECELCNAAEQPDEKEQNKMIFKEAVKLNDKYKAIMLDLWGMENDDQRVIDEVKFQLDNLETTYSVDEELEMEGYTEAQIKRMKNTAIKHLKGFLEKYDDHCEQCNAAEQDQAPEEVKAEENLTEKETVLLHKVVDALSVYKGEYDPDLELGFSDIELEDLSSDTRVDRGVLSSLIKKGWLHIFEDDVNGDRFDFIHLRKKAFDLYQDVDKNECSHKGNETIDIPGTDEAITICHDCGYEI